MEDANGFKLDISEFDSPAPQDLVSIRINVDDFDEAYQMLIAKGFQNFYGEQTLGEIINNKTSTETAVEKCKHQG